jgi:glycosyltransferase involved in cell wall biosynthesis
MVRTASSDALKVLHAIPSISPRYGGPSRAVVEMCRALRGIGVDTLIATTDADGAGRLPVKLGQQILYDEVPTIFFQRQWSEAYKYSRPLAQWLGAHVKDFSVVHIHAVFSHACLAAASACAKDGVPYIVRPLGTLDPWSMKQKRVRKTVFWHLGVRRMLEGAAAIHYTARLEQELAESSLGLKGGDVIPLGVATAARPLRAEKNGFHTHYALGDSPYVLVLSRFHPKKGIELLLRAFLPLIGKPEFAHWKLILAGDGEPAYVDKLQRLVMESQGNGSVIFTGWLEGLQKDATLKHASLLALPSYQENFGLCVLESLACGVPVLISPHVNLAPEIEASGAGWISPLNCEALSATLAEALSNSQAREKRGQAGRELVEQRFTWPAVAAELSSLYGSIVNLRAREHLSLA